MVWKIVNIDSPGSAGVFGGNDMNKNSKYHSGFDLKLDDDTDGVEVGTDTVFYNEKFGLLSPTTGFKYIFRTQDITADRYISLPLMEDDGEISLSATTSANDYGDHMQTYRHQNIQFRNPANTFSYIWNTSAIVANRTVTLPLLTGNDTVVFANATQTLTNKTLTSPTISAMTINTDANTIKHSTTNNAGDLLVNTGSKFDRLARGGANQVPVMNGTGTGLIWIDQTSLDVAGGGGGDSALPHVGNTITGSWTGTTDWQGNGHWVGLLTNLSTVTNFAIADTSGRIGVTSTCATTGNVAGFRTTNQYFTRDSDPYMWVRYAINSGGDTGYRLVIGFVNPISSSYTTTDHLVMLASRHGLIWLHSPGNTNIWPARNDGDASGDSEIITPLLSGTDTGIHDIAIFSDSVNNRFGMSLDGGTITYFTTEIPSSGTRLGCIIMFENTNSTSKTFTLYGAYCKNTVI